ncbi:DsbE family thiol:disulfide interchange protein [Aestuariibius insulae]|uniref:DsbE family thiol:disulfide interchange protein n=1 Tax=Aestuariibius insulae TaxID=2058287 RepID=UPI00345E18D8
MNKAVVFIPAGVFGALAGLFLVGLLRDDPDALPSALVGQGVPDIAAEALPGYETFDSAVLREDGVKVVNFWASWCPPCRAEHPALMELAAEGVPIYGVNKSDQGGDAAGFLEELGNPYAAVTVDLRGRQSLDWGVVALPETFIVDGAGVVRFRFAGPIHGVMESTIRPELEAAGR